MKKQLLRIATRKSPLALWQAEYIGRKLQEAWPDIEIKLLPMVTAGDKFLKDKLQAKGGKGMFVKELEEALLANKADLAVHSLKDVPAFLPEDLCLNTICKRANPFDALVGLTKTSLASLPPKAIIGTSSLRRQAQLLAQRPDIEVKLIRGNVNTRLDKLHKGEFDALILAMAGLERLELNSYVQEIFSAQQMLPACGQGALGIECRQADSAVQELLKPLHDPLSATCVSAERFVNAILGGNCHVPVAIYCSSLESNRLLLRAKVMSIDGKTCIYDEQTGPIQKSLELAQDCASKLLAMGASQLLAEV